MQPLLQIWAKAVTGSVKGPACPWSRLLKQTWSLIQTAAMIFSSKPGDEAIDSNRMRRGYLQSFWHFITLLAALRERMLWQTELSFRVDKPRFSKFDAWGDRFVRNIELWLWEHRRGTRPHGDWGFGFSAFSGLSDNVGRNILEYQKM